MNIDDRLTALRRRRRPLGPLATAAVVVAVVAGTSSVGLLALGGAQASADENRSAQAAARLDVTIRAASVTVPAPASAAPDAPTPEPEPEPEPGYPVYDADTDVKTLDLSGLPEGDSIDNARIWVQQQGIIADCMAEQGYHYTFTLSWERDGSLPAPYVEPGTTEWYALYGSPDNVGDAYRWQDAGCVGYAVHVTGMDDAH